MTSSTSIHRLLDEAFAGVAPSADVQDLKEELRANLMARAEELQACGATPDAAARTAFEELGDVTALIADAATDARPDWERHRVRYTPAFVVRATLVPILSAAALVAGLVLASASVTVGPVLGGALVALFALGIGFLVADSLMRESASSYAMPTGRAVGYGVGVALILVGAGRLALIGWTSGPTWLWIVLGSLLVLAGIGVLAGLGATQTNRMKPWVLTGSSEYAASYEPKPNRFTTDPNAAARFGIYTMLIWVVATVAAVLIGIFVGWWWAALPWIAAFVAMMLLLTQMLFKSERTGA